MHDGKKYTDLLLRYRELIWRLCRRYARRNPERCAELVQEVSVALWEHYGRLRKDATPFEERAWVIWNTRAVLVAIERHPQVKTVTLAARMLDSIADDRDRDRELVAELMAALSDDDRRLLQLRLDGYSAEEIGGQMGLTRNAVYQRIYRIINKLKQISNE